MSEIYISYSGVNGFKRADDKGALSGKVVSYNEFKSICRLQLRYRWVIKKI